MDEIISIYYDSECPLCDKFLIWILGKRYIEDNLSRIMPLSEWKVDGSSHLNKSHHQSIIIVTNKSILFKSKAILSLIKWNKPFGLIFFIILYPIPTCILNFIYDIIASNRQKIFRSNECKIIKLKKIQ